MKGGIKINTRRIFSVLLIGTIIIFSLIYKNTKGKDSPGRVNSIKVLNYTASKAVKNSVSFNLNTYTNKNSLGWLSDYEILTETKKADLENPYSAEEVKYLSIYNVDTGKAKDFIDVNEGKFLSISPDKKYVLYEEAKCIPKMNEAEWQGYRNSGEIYNYKIKLLNLDTGEITDFKTQDKNYEATYQWLDTRKLLIYYPSNNQQWEILDFSGKVYKSGKINDPQTNYHLTDIKMINAKVSENETTGTLILNYLLPTNESTGTSQFTMVDITTKKEKILYTSKGQVSYKIQNNFLLIGECCESKSNIYYFDENGVKKGEYSFQGKIDLGSYNITKDDTKVAICEQTASSPNTPISLTTNLDILDLQNGKVMKLFKTTAIVESKNMNLCWNDDGTALTFNVINKIVNLNDTYLIRIQ